VDILLTKAADMGYMRARFIHAQLYFQDERPGSNDLGLEYLRLSASLGYAGAQLDLAMRYMDGHGVPKDIRKAYFWFLLAGEHVEVASPLFRIEKMLSPEELSDIKRSAEWGRMIAPKP
jgi:hypothetical protein